MRTPPVLADAAAVLSESARAQIRRLARLLKPYSGTLDRRFRLAIRSRRYDAKQLKALSAITPGAAARLLADGRPLADFFEQVEYSGRRLAKLNVPPSEIVEALRAYDAVLGPLLSKLGSDASATASARQHLRLAAVLTLNSAFHQVRETEAGAFYDLFRAEVEAQNLDELLTHFLRNLTRICQAQAGRLVLLSQDRRSWRARASVSDESTTSHEFQLPKLTASLRRSLGATRYVVHGGSGEYLILDKAMRGRYRSYWSVPLMFRGEMAGVIQVGFSTERSWLPRELELLHAVVEQCLMGAEKARLVEDLAAREEQIRQLSEHMFEVEEEERRRISRELHDDAGQSMLLIRLQLEMLEKSLTPEQSSVRSRLAETRDVTERTIIELRRVIAALSPAVLEQLGLAPAIRQLTMRFKQIFPGRIRLSIPQKLNQMGRFPRQIEIIAYRLVQECFNNIAKHSAASTVQIHLRSSDTYLELRVEDDGVGFKVEDGLEKRDSFGLSGMRERVGLAGGKFQVESRPGSGTRVSVKLPLSGSATTEG